MLNGDRGPAKRGAARYVVALPILVLSLAVGCGRERDVPAGWNDPYDDSDSSEYHTSRFGDSELAAIERLADDEFVERLQRRDATHWRAIRIEQGALSDAAFSSIRGLAPNLEQVVLRQCPLTDVAATQLAELPRLGVINIPQSQLTDAGIRTLASLPELHFVRIGSPQLTDESLSTLRRCKKIRFIHLIDAPITDAGLKALHGWDQLESLYLDGSRVSGAGVEELLRQCPQLHLHLDQKHHDVDPRKDHS